MKIDHISVYTDPRPTRVSLAVSSGQRSSVTAAGTVPSRSPPRTTPSMRRLGPFRTRQYDRTKRATPKNIHRPNTGAKEGYVGATWALGPKAFDETPSMISPVIEIR